MIVALGALALVSRVPVGVLAVVATAALQPVVFLLVVGLWSVAANLVMRNRAGPAEEAAFLRALAAELASGASLRRGLVEATSRSTGLQLGPALRLAVSGAGAARIGSALRSALPVNGAAAASAFRLADAAGGKLIPTVLALADRADEMSRLHRERMALTAQARASAWLVGGAPIALLLVMTLAGAGPDMSGLGGAGRVLITVGVGLIALGSIVVWWMVRRP